MIRARAEISAESCHRFCPKLWYISRCQMIKLDLPTTSNIAEGSRRITLPIRSRRLISQDQVRGQAVFEEVATLAVGDFVGQTNFNMLARFVLHAVSTRDRTFTGHVD